MTAEQQALLNTALRIRRTLSDLERALREAGRTDLAGHASTAWDDVQEITRGLRQ